MCVIYNSIHGNHPTAKQLKMMFNSNPHGAGFAIREGKKWQILKGLMTIKELKTIYPKLKSADEVIGHFRLATHGAINELNCNPFALSNIYTEAQECQDAQDGVLFHNGILNTFGHEHLSDTLDFTVSVLSKLSEADRVALLNIISGKFIYLDSMGEVHTVGLEHHTNGFLVSNSYWDYSSSWNEDVFYPKQGKVIYRPEPVDYELQEQDDHLASMTENYMRGKK